MKASGTLIGKGLVGFSLICAGTCRQNCFSSPTFPEWQAVEEAGYMLPFFYTLSQ